MFATASVHPVGDNTLGAATSSIEKGGKSELPSLFDESKNRWQRGNFMLPYELNVTDKRSFLSNLGGSILITLVLAVPFFLSALPAVFLPAPGTEHSKGVVGDCVMIFFCDIVFGIGIAPLIFGGDVNLLQSDGNWKKAFKFFLPRWCFFVAMTHYAFYFSTGGSSDFALHYVMFPFYFALVGFPFLELGAHWVATEKTILKSTFAMQWQNRLGELSKLVIALVLAVTSCFIPIVYMVCDTEILVPLADGVVLWSAVRVVLNLVARKMSTVLIGWGTYLHPNPMWRVFSPSMSYWILGMMNAKTGANSSDWKAIAMFVLVDWLAFLSRVVQATHIPEDNKNVLLRLPLSFVRIGSAITPDLYNVSGWTSRDLRSAHRMFALMLKDMGTTSTFVSFILLYPVMKYCDSTGAMYAAVFPSGDTSLLYMLVMFANDLVQDIAVHAYTHFFYKKNVSYRRVQTAFFTTHVATQLSAVLWMPAIMLWLTWHFASPQATESQV